MRKKPRDEKGGGLDYANKRTKTDGELREILEKFDDGELHGLMFGMLPVDKVEPGELTGKDTARLMEMNPKGHY